MTHDSIDLDLSDRLFLAHASLVLTSERRDGFISDDDVLDAAAEWSPTITDVDGDEYFSQPAYESYVELRDVLFTVLVGPEGEEDPS